jgi:hypothetical protein
MTTMTEVSASAPVPALASNDRRGSWIPTGSMITTRLMELRKRRGLMIALVVVNIGIPTIFLVVRLLGHAFAPHSYGPAGGYDIFTNLVAGVMYVFGFIVAATLGCTAGSVDLSEGMFRHLVVTGRSRLALYLARIPAGLAIVLPLVAVGFTIVCTVCVFAAPTSISYDGANVPAHLSLTGFETWAQDHPSTVFCDFPYPGPTPVNFRCGGGPINSGPGNGFKVPPGTPAPTALSAAAIKTEVTQIAQQTYGAYHRLFLYPSNSLMIKTGLWLELEAAIGFIVGLGLASPIVSTHIIPHAINLERGIVGLATAHIEPGGLPLPFGGGGGGGPGGPGRALLVPESITVAICVIVGWVVVWTALGAWRMMTRDA